LLLSLLMLMLMRMATEIVVLRLEIADAVVAWTVHRE
jgi:hypothetical protein